MQEPPPGTTSPDSLSARIEQCERSVPGGLRVLAQMLADESALDDRRPLNIDKFQEQFLHALREEAKDYIQRGNGLLLGSEYWKKLRTLATYGESEVKSRALVAWALLQALDEAIGERMGELFQCGKDKLVLKPGDIFPIATSTKEELLDLLGNDTSLTPQPAKFQHPSVRLNHLGIMPSLTTRRPYEVELIFDKWATLSSFTAKPIIGVLLPNVDAQKELKLSLHEAAQRFFYVKPRWRSQQQHRVQQLLALAAQSGVTLAMLPELSMTHMLQRSIYQQFVDDDRSCSTIMAGSAHQRRRGRKLNRALILVSGAKAPPFQHDKFNPYELGRWKDKRYSPPLQEDIPSTTLRLKVYWMNGWSFTTLICKDFLEPDVQHLLATLKLNFVFVVSYSGDTGTFKSLAEALAYHGQTSTFIANFGGQRSADSDAALAILPDRTEGGVIPIRYPTSKIGEPSLLILDVRKRKEGWRPLRKMPPAPASFPPSAPSRR